MSGPKSNLRVSLVQMEIQWENPMANCAILEEKLQVLQGKTDVIILPEMFTTGFSMNEVGAEYVNGPSLKWLKVMSTRLSALIIGSLKFKEKNQYFNRLLAVFPSGEIKFYDKRHLFRMGQEHQFYSAGDQQVIITYLDWKIAPFVCYDLRFPVWSRNVKYAYDLAIYVANWPAVRNHPWNILLKARAIENLAYVAGVNRIGKDGNEVYYQGDSALLSCKGEEMIHLNDREDIQTGVLSANDLYEFRKQFPADLDADEFQISDSH